MRHHLRYLGVYIVGHHSGYLGVYIVGLHAGYLVVYIVGHHAGYLGFYFVSPLAIKQCFWVRIHVQCPERIGRQIDRLARY